MKHEREKEDLNLHIAENKQRLNSQRLVHEKRVQEMNEEIEKMAKTAKVLEERLCLQKREHEQEGVADRKKAQELEMFVVHSIQESEDLQNKLRKLEKEKEDLELSIAEKERSSFRIQREEPA